MDFWVRAAQLLLSLSLLIVLHEFGHFIAARVFKTKVEKFYLFFDWKFSLLKKKIGDTEWGIGWIPLGGYVKIAGMVDESMDTEQLSQPAQPWEFRAKPAWQRLIIMLGGIIVNVIVGFVLFIMVTMIWGEEKVNNDKLANGVAVHPYMEQFGFRSGDKVLRADGEKVSNFPKLGSEILIFNKRNFEVLHADGKKESIELPENIGKMMWNKGAEQGTFDFRYFTGSIDSVLPNSSAARIKLKEGDKILAVNGKKIVFHDEMTSSLYHNIGKKVELSVKRGDTILKKELKVGKEGQLGIMTNNKITTDTAAIYTQYYGFGESIGKGMTRGYKMIYSNIAQFKYVFTSKGASSVGGLGSMGKMFPPVWNWEAFWTLTAFLSMMLAVMNLLPIPALDGGHVIFLIYEIITRKPAPQRVLELAQYVGIFLLLGLMLYANGKDILGAFS
jgi:regulator of sigma E protease